MASVELDTQEWQQVISALAMTNPVLVKISSQLAQQQEQQQARAQAVANIGIGAAAGGLHPGNSKEPHHGL